MQMKLLNEDDIDFISVGASFLSSGGGGDPYIGKKLVIQEIEKNGPIKLASIDEFSQNDLVVAIGGIGSPAIIIEKIPNGEEAEDAFLLMEHYLNKKISAIYPIEIGGINSLLPLAAASRVGLPVVDVDTMGRAFPEYHMTTLSIGGISASPFIVIDSMKNSCIIHTKNNLMAEKIARDSCNEMGGAAFLSAYPVTCQMLKKSAILGTLTLSWEIGKKIEMITNVNGSVVDAVLCMLNGFLLCTAKIINVDRAILGGFISGIVYLEGIGEYKNKHFKVHFKNEYLLIEEDNNVLCSTPDSIILLDEDRGIPILSERLKYGMHVNAIAIPSNEKWRTKSGIDIVGPKCFGYDIDYQPVENLRREK
nr:hypothetical protein pSG2.04 [Sodalis glossinidius]CAI59578.1 hypothetical protein pSG2.04 [Sodalis glossinidius]